VAIVMLQEQIAQGQRVEEYEVEARTSDGWRTLVKGTTIGHKKLDRIEPVTIEAVRVHVRKGLAPPMLRRVGLFG
jgi:alpha-L-fucosidase